MNGSIIHNYNRAWTGKRITARKDLIFNEFFEGFGRIGSLLEIPCNETIDSVYGKNGPTFGSFKGHIFMRSDPN